MSDSKTELFEEIILSVDEEMRLVLKSGAAEVDPFLGMIHYQMGWCNKHFEPVKSSSGKRIRPLLCLLSCQAAGGDWHQAIPAGVALELLHNFTLIHDDIQDASPTRRGRPTVWKLWSAKQAINVGDAMFALAHIGLGRMQSRGVNAVTVNQALMRLDETCLDLTYGQYKDMDFEERAIVSVDEYLQMIGGKTAALLSLSSELGALVAGVDRELTDHYAEFGRDLGFAFQVRDDILGIWGDESVIGKSAATDIATRKKSLPVLYGLEQSGELRALYSRSDDDSHFVTKAVKLLDRVGARDFAEQYESKYAESALSNLGAANPEGQAANALHQLTNNLLSREK
jgi:geranylgeranyl diphosphate synthase type I